MVFNTYRMCTPYHLDGSANSKVSSSLKNVLGPGLGLDTIRRACGADRRIGNKTRYLIGTIRELSTFIHSFIYLFHAVSRLHQLLESTRLNLSPYGVISWRGGNATTRGLNKPRSSISGKRKSGNCCDRLPWVGGCTVDFPQCETVEDMRDFGVFFSPQPSNKLDVQVAVELVVDILILLGVLVLCLPFLQPVLRNERQIVLKMSSVEAAARQQIRGLVSSRPCLYTI